jgi:glycosyltransferase involved in cell wall biosynthesis
MSGGAETMLAKLVDALPAPGHRHVVASLMSGGLIEERLRATGVEVVTLGATRSWRAAGLAGRLGALVARVDPDLVQGWMYHGNLAASVVARRSRPVVWNVRQSLEHLSDNRPLTRAVILAGGLLAWSPKRIIYNAQAAAPQHERWGYPSAKRVIIANGIETDRFRPDPDTRAWLRAQLGQPADAPLLLRAGRDDPMKDHPTLLAAFAAIRRDLPAARLLLVGRGMMADNARLTSAIAAAGVGDAVDLLGERSDMARLTAGCDLALSSSARAEGFPNILGEAMACAVPAVVTDVGDCRSILDDPRRVVPPGDIRRLADAALAVLRLSAAERAALGARDRARVLARYAMPAIAETYADLWRRVVSGA